MIRPVAEVTIRPAIVADAGAIAAFNCALALETEAKALDPNTVLAGVQTLLTRDGLGFYLVAEVAAEPVACLLVTYEWSDWRNGLFWWIQSVYVKPEFRRRDIFRQLYRQVQTWAAADGGVCGPCLYVEQHNHAAQATYETRQMTPTGYLVFEALVQ